MGCGGEFAQLCFVAVLFPLRLPKDPLLIKRAFADDMISEFAARPDNARIGVKKCGSLDVLIIKMAFRKNLTGGAFLRGHAYFATTTLWEGKYARPMPSGRP